MRYHCQIIGKVRDKGGKRQRTETVHVQGPSRSVNCSRVKRVWSLPVTFLNLYLARNSSCPDTATNEGKSVAKKNESTNLCKKEADVFKTPKNELQNVACTTSRKSQI